MKLQDVLKEESEKKYEYRIMLAIPFADNNNIKHIMTKLEFVMKANDIEIVRIASSTLGQDVFLDVVTGLRIKTSLKRTAIEDLLEPDFKIMSFKEVKNAS